MSRSVRASYSSKPEYCSLCRRQRSARSSPSATRARTGTRLRPTSTSASGVALRLSDQAGVRLWPALEPITVAAHRPA